MDAVNDALFKDDDLAGMYCNNNKRPSVSGIVLLQFYDDVSDEEANTEQARCRCSTPGPSPPLY